MTNIHFTLIFYICIFVLQEIPATDNGMLGGFAHISSADIAGSRKFLQEFLVKRCYGLDIEFSFSLNIKTKLV
jgi:hypothetical protein